MDVALGFKLVEKSGFFGAMRMVNARDPLRDPEAWTRNLVDSKFCCAGKQSELD